MSTKERDSGNGRAVSVAFGIVSPLVIQALITIFLLRLQHAGATDVSRVTLVSYVLTSLAGFALIMRNHGARPLAAIALFYFPVMFSLMFLEALYLDGRLYGNSF